MLIINVSLAAIQHIRMISEGSYYTALHKRKTCILKYLWLHVCGFLSLCFPCDPCRFSICVLVCTCVLVDLWNVISRVGYRSHLNRYQYRYRYLEFGTGTQRYLFSVLYSLCNNKNIYFSEKNKSKTLNFNILNNRALHFFLISFLPEFFVLFFSNNQMKAWNIYLFLIKWKWNPFIFLANKQRFTVKIKVIIVLNFLNLFHFNIVFKFAIKFSLVFISFIHIFVSFSLVFILWTFLFSFYIV